RGAAVPRQLRAHEVDEVAVELDDLLPGAGSRRGDVAGEGERAGAEVEGRDRLARLADQVDDVRHPLDVLVGELGRIVQVHVRLRGAVDDQLEGAAPPAVGTDLGDRAGAQPLRPALVHASILTSSPRISRRPVRSEAQAYTPRQEFSQ